MNKRYTLDEFISLTKEDPNSWISYCEIIIDPEGYIILARPSHQECLIHYVMNLDNITRQDVYKMIPSSYLATNFIIDKYNLVCVWYNYYMVSKSGFTINQMNTIEGLKNCKLIAQYASKEETNEYNIYLKHKSIGLI